MECAFSFTRATSQMQPYRKAGSLTDELSNTPILYYRPAHISYALCLISMLSFNQINRELKINYQNKTDIFVNSI